MTDRQERHYDSARGKRIALEITPLAMGIGVYLGWKAHEPWWLIVPAAVLAGVANYWFWRACDYLAYRVIGLPGSES